MAGRVTKRRRTDSLPQPAQLAMSRAAPKFDCEKGVARLPVQRLRDLVIAAARTYPSFMELIQDEVNKIDAEHAAKVVDLDYHSKTAWRVLNVEYSKLSGSHQYDRAWDAVETIEACFKAIRKACPEYASYGTKKSGLETCRKIGKSICLSDGVIGAEVRKSFQEANVLEETRMWIARTLNQDERDRLMNDEFGGKLKELVKLSDTNCVLPGLSEVLSLMQEDYSQKENTREFIDLDYEEDDDEE